MLAATCGVRVQVPTPTKLTVRWSTPTVQTPGVDEVTDGAPSLLVLRVAVKLPLKTGPAGMFEIVGGVGVAGPTVKASGLPSAAV